MENAGVRGEYGLRVNRREEKREADLLKTWPEVLEEECLSEAGAGKCEATPVFSQPQVKMYRVGCCFIFQELGFRKRKSR